MTTNLREEDGWLVEVAPITPEPMHTTAEEDDTTTRHCKRCRKDQPVENFTRLVSEKQALFLARKEGIATTTQEYYERAAIHRTVLMAHKLCNTCAAKLRKEKRESAEDYDKRLRIMKRYERLVPNPYYISPSKTPHEPLTITEREVKVRKYRSEQGVRRVDSRRRNDKARYAVTYAAQMREVRNEMQRIDVRKRSLRAQGDEVLTTFLNDYTEHLKNLRDTIRAERYSYAPNEPLKSAFSYINYDSVTTKDALRAMRCLPDFELDRISPRLLPTADLYNERAEREKQQLEKIWE
jgi:hypothetical protein